MEVECPIEGCDYTGSVDSVLAHISGKSTGRHKGENGFSYKEELADTVLPSSYSQGVGEEGAEAAESEAEDDDGEEPESTEEESPEGQSGSGGPSGNSTPGEAALSPSTRDGTGVGASAAPAAATAAFLGIGSGDGSRKVLLGVALLVVLLVWFNTTRGGPEPGQEDYNEERQEALEEDRAGGGLVG